jgi:hypothetical protein
MQPIDGNLLAAQGKLPQRPVVSAALVDVVPLNFIDRHSGLSFPAYSARGVGVSWPGRIVRVIPEAWPSTALRLQVITDVNNRAQWESAATLAGSAIKLSTDFGLGLARVWGPGLDRLLLVYWSAVGSGGQFPLVYRYSDNRGTTWSAESAIPGYNYYDQYWDTGRGAELTTVSKLALTGGPAGRAGFFYRRLVQVVYQNTEAFEGDQPVFVPYSALGGWGSASAPAPAVSGEIADVAATWDEARQEQILVRATRTAQYARLILTRYNPTGGVWSGNSTLQSRGVVLVQDGFGALSLSESTPAPGRGYHWLTFRTYEPSPSQYLYQVLPLNAQLRPAGLFEFCRNAPNTPSLNVFVHYQAVTQQLVLSNFAQVKVSSPVLETTGLAVLDYAVEAGRWGQALVCRVDNRAGVIADTPILATLKLERGLLVDGVARQARLPAFYVTKFRFEQQDKIAVFEGVDGLGLLALWRATDTWLWENETAQEILTALCSQARLTPVFSGDRWGEVLAGFSLHPGASGLEAVQRLLGLLGGVGVVSEVDSLKFFTLEADAWDYALATCWESSFGRNVRANYAYAVGREAGTGGDFSRETEGYRLALYHTDARLDSTIAAQARAQHILTEEESRLRASGRLVAPVNHGLQVLDRIVFDTGWAAGKTWEVTGFTEAYRGSGEWPYCQEVRLRDV